MKGEPASCAKAPEFVLGAGLLSSISHKLNKISQGDLHRLQGRAQEPSMMEMLPVITSWGPPQKHHLAKQALDTFYS